MSTHAYWRLWVGADIDTFYGVLVSDRILPLMDETGFYNVAGLKLEYIYMHGRKVGLGVQVAEVDWTTQIRHDNLFDTKKVEKARSLVPRVKKLFKKLGIRIPVKIYHHIDLGG